MRILVYIAVAIAAIWLLGSLSGAKQATATQPNTAARNPLLESAQVKPGTNLDSVRIPSFTPIIAVTTQPQGFYVESAQGTNLNNLKWVGRG